MKIQLLSSFLMVSGAVSASAFCPPRRLATQHVLRSTTDRTTSTEAEEVLIGADDLNEGKFLADMNQALPMDATNPGDDPAYIAQARLRFAALADKGKQLKAHYAEEIKALRSKSVWESFGTSSSSSSSSKTIKPVKKKEKVAAVTAAEVETATSNTVWIGVAMVVAVASVLLVDPAALTEFAGKMNLNLDVDLSAFNLDGIDVTAIQEQVQANVALLLVWLREMQGVVQSQLAQTQLAMSESMDSLKVGSLPTLANPFQGLQIGQLDWSSQVGRLQSQVAQAQSALAESMDAIQIGPLPSFDLPAMDLKMDQLEWSNQMEELQSTVASQLASSQETISQMASQMESSTSALQSDLVAGVSSWKDAALNAQEGWISSTVILANSLQEQALEAIKTLDADWKNMQETLANTDWESSVPSVLTSAGEDLKALLRQ